MTTDLDRLLELAEKAVDVLSGQPVSDHELRMAGERFRQAASPDTIIGLIERVKEAKQQAYEGFFCPRCGGVLLWDAPTDVISCMDCKRSWGKELEARLRAAEEVLSEVRAIPLQEDERHIQAVRDALRHYDEAQKARSTP